MTKQMLIPKALTNAIETANKEHKLASDNALHVKNAMRTQVRHTINVGKALLKAKEKCGHGQWESLFDESNRTSKGPQNVRFDFTSKTARLYMKVAKYPNQAKLLAGDLTSFNLDKVYSGLKDATAEKEVLTDAGRSIVDDDEWHTPAEYIEAARRVMGSIDCDPASNDIAQQTVKAGVYYTKDNCGLDPAVEWNGNVWMNPPYSKKLCAPFCEKLLHQWHDGNINQAVVLINSTTDTEYWQELAKNCSAFCFVRGRIAFVKNGEPIANNSKGQTIFYFGLSEDFRNVFCDFGSVGVME
jgi:phage N-6-adenine-methyltransferase